MWLKLIYLLHFAAFRAQFPRHRTGRKLRELATMFLQRLAQIYARPLKRVRGHFA